MNGDRFIFTPEQILAMQLTKLKDLTESELKSKVVDVVLNVPTYYTDAERRSVLDASRIAGLNCVKLVNDLTAGKYFLNFICLKLGLPMVFTSLIYHNPTSRQSTLHLLLLGTQAPKFQFVLSIVER